MCVCVCVCVCVCIISVKKNICEKTEHIWHKRILYSHETGKSRIARL